MKRFIILIFISVQILNLRATTQVDDLLVINKDTFFIESPIDNIGDSAFQNFWARKIINYDCLSSGCWRGAICTWTIRNDSLLLIKMISYCDKKQIYLSMFFGSKEQVFAKWFDGKIHYSSGNLICHNIFENQEVQDHNEIYEYDHYEDFKRGVLIKSVKFDNRRTRVGGFKNVEAINHEIEKCLNIFVIANTDIMFSLNCNIDSLGIISNIQLYSTQNALNESEIFNALSKVNNLPVYYKDGKFVNRKLEGDFVIIKNNTR